MRIAVSAKNSKIPLERKYGAAGIKAVRLLSRARQAAKTLGVTFHVGSQTATPDAFVQALGEVGNLIVKAGVALDRPRRWWRLSVRLLGRRTGPLSALRARHMPMASNGCRVGEHCRLMCETRSRALWWRCAGSLIVRVDARRGNGLFVNDGVPRSLSLGRGTHGLSPFPVRLIGRELEADGTLGSLCLLGANLRRDRLPHALRATSPAFPPRSQASGDYIEIGNTGSPRSCSGRALQRLPGAADDEAIRLDLSHADDVRGANRRAPPAQVQA